MNEKNSKMKISNNWKMKFFENEKVLKHNIEIKNKADFYAADIKEIENPTVPGCFELDYIKQNNLGDIYFGENILSLQKLENMHLWYYTTFDIPEGFENPYLLFEGLDTAADIYVNGILLKSTQNMMISHTVSLEGFFAGENELVVHIKPIAIEARKYHQPAACNVWKYNDACFYIRKPAHSFGWDILPRALTSGIFKPVYICNKTPDRINEVFLYTVNIDTDKKTAKEMLFFDTDITGDFVGEYYIELNAICKDKSFSVKKKMWHTVSRFEFEVEDCLFWWPKNAGAANLYEVTVKLWHNDTLCDTFNLNHGIRTVELVRRPTKDELDVGEFCLNVNGRNIFVMGTNWVPLSPFHSEEAKILPRALELLDDTGCNMVRWWGGNLYPDEAFLEFCDQKGIMLWQDFSLACAVYPNDDLFMSQLSEEVVSVIKRLRNRASLVLWCGSNETDYAYKLWGGVKRDPNTDVITREFIGNLLKLHDFTRPYLESSPYISKDDYINEAALPETHLWGPRYWFKEPFYKNHKSRFVSETGYFGAPSTETAKSFISKQQLWPWYGKDYKPNSEWLVHAASMENVNEDNPYAFRLGVLTGNVKTLFGEEPSDYNTFAKQSQISQAEALKYYIERLRLRKWERTGIIWWNLLDAWPQFSDAVVDSRFNKKLAYHYIKRSQNPVCLMLDEPIDGVYSLYAVNDITSDEEVEYRVTNLSTKELLAYGRAVIPENSACKIAEFKTDTEPKCFYLIEWVRRGENYSNHYYQNIINISFEEYMANLKECGYDQFEGME